MASSDWLEPRYIPNISQSRYASDHLYILPNICHVNHRQIFGFVPGVCCTILIVQRGYRTFLRSPDAYRRPLNGGLLCTLIDDLRSTLLTPMYPMYIFRGRRPKVRVPAVSKFVVARSSEFICGGTLVTRLLNAAVSVIDVAYHGPDLRAVPGHITP